MELHPDPARKLSANLYDIYIYIYIYIYSIAVCICIFKIWDKLTFKYL